MVQLNSFCFFGSSSNRRMPTPNSAQTETLGVQALSRLDQATIIAFSVGLSTTM